VTTAALLLVAASPGRAVADEVDGGGGGWGVLELTGDAGAYAGSMSLGGGFPAATITSTSRSGGVGVQTGASTFLNAATPPGDRYGSSRNGGYLTLRPAADRPDAPSVTTYTFATPTPTTGWTFVLGDIDADRVVISAQDVDGSPVSASGLGFEGVFSYCGGCRLPAPRPTRPVFPAGTRRPSRWTGT
jgi:hypothetical protein